MRTINRAAGFALAAAAAWAANAQSDQASLGDLSVEQLKAMSLRCDQRARADLLAPVDAGRCSRVFEALLARGFDGDFSRLLAWWRVARSSSVCNDPDATPDPEDCDDW